MLCNTSMITLERSQKQHSRTTSSTLSHIASIGNLVGDIVVILFKGIYGVTLHQGRNKFNQFTNDVIGEGKNECSQVVSCLYLDFNLLLLIRDKTLVEKKFVCVNIRKLFVYFRTHK